MPITAQYQPPERELPDEETGPVICCDLFQDQPRINQYGYQETPLRFIFLLGGRPMKDGRPFAVSVFHSLPIRPDNKLAKFLGDWRGKPLTLKELKEGIDLEKFALGRTGQASVYIAEPNGKDEVWPKISSLVPLPKALEKNVPSIKDYVRIKDSPEKLEKIKKKRQGQATENAIQKRQDEQGKVPF